MSSEVAELTNHVSDVPDGWQSSTLGKSLARAEGGGTPTRDVKEYWNGDIPWASVKDIVKGNGSIPEETITAAGLANSTSRVVAAGTNIFVARMGVGAVTRYPMDVAINQDLMALTPAKGLDPDYLYHWLRFKKAAFLAVATGTTVKGIRKDLLLSFPLFLPPPDEQRRIAEVLRSVDEAIAAAEDALTASHAVHRLSIESLFGICFSEAQIEGEKLATIRQVCKRVTYGFTNPMPTTDEGPWMLTAANVRHGWIDYKSARRTSSLAYANDISEKSRPPIGAVLVTKDGTLGRVAVVDRAEVCINQSVAVLIPDVTKVDGGFLSYLLQCPTGQARMLADSGGSSVKHIYISKLAELPFALPPMDVQQERAMFAQESEQAVQDQTRVVGGLHALKSHLMANLLSGLVRVPA